MRAPADGHTLLLAFTSNAINATLYHKLNFDFINDIAPIPHYADANVSCMANPSFPVRNVPELIAYAKANPGKVNMASGGHGALGHVSGELFKAMTGTNMTIRAVSRRRGGAHRFVGRPSTDFIFPGSPRRSKTIRAGETRALAVTTAERGRGVARRSDRELIFARRPV